MAFVYREQVVVALFPQFALEPVELNLKSPAVQLKQLTTEGGNFVSWLDAKTVAWVFGNHLYSQSFDGAAAERLGAINLTVPRQRPSGKIAFKDARLITMKGDEVIERGTVVVDRNRIVAAGPSGNVQIPCEAAVVDAAGMTIMPGLTDVKP